MPDNRGDLGKETIRLIVLLFGAIVAGTIRLDNSEESERTFDLFAGLLK